VLRLKQPTHLTPMDDVLLNKAGIMERCLRRVAEEYVRRPFGKGASRALGKGATPRRVGV